jgi:hypothetical protein
MPLPAIAAVLAALKAVQAVICNDLINRAVDHLVAGVRNEILTWVWDAVETVAGEAPSAETIAARAPQIEAGLVEVQATYDALKADAPEQLVAAKALMPWQEASASE